MPSLPARRPPSHSGPASVAASSGSRTTSLATSRRATSQVARKRNSGRSRLDSWASLQDPRITAEDGAAIVGAGDGGAPDGAAAAGGGDVGAVDGLSLIHISEPTRP